MPDVTQSEFQQSRAPDQNSPKEIYVGQNMQSSQMSSLILLVLQISKDPSGKDHLGKNQYLSQKSYSS